MKVDNLFKSLHYYYYIGIDEVVEIFLYYIALIKTRNVRPFLAILELISKITGHDWSQYSN